MLPEWFKNKLVNEYGEELAREIEQAFSVRRKTTFRVNTIKSESDEIKSFLNERGINYKIIQEFFINENEKIEVFEIDGSLENQEIYKLGKIYVQNPSSMIPPIVLEPKENEDILDMTAAPGGKTTELAMISKNKANITGVEQNKIRFERLKYNVDLQGAKVFLMNTNSNLLDNFLKFDKILLDAPCTGSGTLNLFDYSIKYFNENLLEKVKKQQLKLLEKAWILLKKNGILVYSTCSILNEENDGIIKAFLKNKKAVIEKIALNLDNIELLKTEINESISIKPDEKYEGFYIIKIKKLGG